MGDAEGLGPTGNCLAPETSGGRSSPGKGSNLAAECKRIKGPAPVTLVLGQPLGLGQQSWASLVCSSNSEFNSDTPGLLGEHPLTLGRQESLPPCSHSPLQALEADSLPSSWVTTRGPTPTPKSADKIPFALHLVQVRDLDPPSGEERGQGQGQGWVKAGKACREDGPLELLILHLDSAHEALERKQTRNTLCPPPSPLHSPIGIFHGGRGWGLGWRPGRHQPG